MCDNIWNLEELINHPKLSDDYKFAIVEEMLSEEAMMEAFDSLNNLGISIDSLGLTIDNIDNLDYIWDINDEDKGVPSSTTQFAQENFAVINLYRYISTEYGPSFIGDNTRPFCKMVVARTNNSLMRREDITRLNSANPGLGKGGSNSYSVFDWRGGANCKHIWVKYKYDTKDMKLVKAPISDQPKNIQVNGMVPYANGTNTPPPRKFSTEGVLPSIINDLNN
jgi:hypothetical protein